MITKKQLVMKSKFVIPEEIKSRGTKFDERLHRLSNKASCQKAYNAIKADYVLPIISPECLYMYMYY